MSVTQAPPTGPARTSADPVAATITLPRAAPSPPLSAARRPRVVWGAVLSLAVPVVLGTALIRVAYALAARSTGGAHFAVFWTGFALVTAAIAVAGCRRAVSLRRRAALLVGYGFVTFLPKLVMSTWGPVYFDEYGHWRH